MNIGIFTDTYKPNINGVAISAENQKKELEKLGHVVYVVASKMPDYIEKDPFVIRVPSVKLLIQPEYRLSNPLNNKIIKQLKSLKLDIVHAMAPFSMGLMGLYVAKTFRIPIIHTFHTLFPEYVHYLKLPSKFTKPIAKKTSALFCNKCDYIIAPSQEVVRQLKEYGVKKKIELLPSGITFSKIENSDKCKIKEKYNIEKDEKVLLFVGRLGKEKNIDFLLDSFALLTQNGENSYKLLLVGDGPYKAKLKAKLKKLNLENKVIFVGYVENSEVHKYYTASDVFIFSSLTETQGLVVLEAMYCEVPVVAVKASGVEDMIENNKSGFLTKLDEKEFCLKIENVIKDEATREEIVKNAKKRTELFSNEKIYKRISEIYLELQQKNRIGKFRKAKIRIKNKVAKNFRKFYRGKK